MNKSKLLYRLAILYLVLPFLIFIGGWTKPYIAIPVILLVLFCTWKACKESPEMWLPEWNRDNMEFLLFGSIIPESENLYFRIWIIPHETAFSIFLWNMIGR